MTTMTTTNKPGLARTVEYNLSSTRNALGVPLSPSLEVILACGAVREFIDEFPDHEVDELFVAELRRRIDTNGQRLIEIGNLIGVNFFFTEHLNAEQLRWRAMLAAY